MLVSEILIIFVLVLLNGFLSMSEMAVVSSRKPRLQALADSGKRGARTALRLSEHSNQFLASIQVGITLVGVFAGAFSGASVADRISYVIAYVMPTFAAYADAIALGVVVVFVSYLSLVLGELVPKRLALANPEAIATNVANIIWFIGKLMTPLVVILSFSTDLILRLFGATRTRDEAVTEEEVKILIEQGAESGVFDKVEELMMKQVLKLDDSRIQDIMTTRMDVICVDVNDPVDSILKTIAQAKHSYFPVYENNIDDIIGMLPIKEVMHHLIYKREVVVKELMKAPLFLPETVTLDIALAKFKDAAEHVACVLDEYGGFAGLVTLHDITESVVGALPDRNTPDEPMVVNRADGSFLIDGRYAFEDFAQQFKIKLPKSFEMDFQTVGGFVMAKLGKVPREGNIVKLKNYMIEVVDMDRNRVDKILLTRRHREKRDAKTKS